MHTPTVLQLCHGYDAPFHSVALQYAAMFKGTPFRVVTVFLKGTYDSTVEESFQPDPVIFLDQTSKDIRGWKRKQVARIRELHKRYQFRFCIAHRYKPIYIASHLRELPVIGIHHIDGVYRRWTRRFHIQRIRKRVILLGVSRAIQQDIVRSLKGFPVERTGYLYNSLDFEKLRTQLFERGHARQKLGIPDGAFVFGTVGRMHPDKDPVTMIKAFALVHRDLPSSRLVMIGDGRLAGEVEAMIAEEGLAGKVILTGRLEGAYRYLGAFDAFILSSVREGLPVALLEAFTAGLVCAVTRCNGNTEAIEGVGYSYDVGDYLGLADLMGRIFRMPAEERASLLLRVEEKLQQTFSSTAVRHAFWGHPSIKPMLADAFFGTSEGAGEGAGPC